MTLVTGYSSAPIQAGEEGAGGRAARVRTYMSGTGYDSADSGGDGLPSVAKTAPTPSNQRQRRSPSDDISTDLTPLDNVAYRTLPLPRITTFKFTGDLRPNHCVTLRSSVEQFFIYNHLRYHDIHLYLVGSHKRKRWHMDITADARETGSFETVVRDIIQQLRGNRDTVVDIEHRPMRELFSSEEE